MNERLKFTLAQREKHPECQEPFIHETAIVHPWVKIGRNVRIHEGCVIGSEGFGYEKDENDEWLHIPHEGGVIIGDDVEIHAGTIICRGTIEDTIIGKGTKIDSQCFIAHNVKIGERNLIVTHSNFGGSSKLGNDCWVGMNCTIINGVSISDGTYLGTGCNVVKDINDEVPHIYVGNPARALKPREGR